MSHESKSTIQPYFLLPSQFANWKGTGDKDDICCNVLHVKWNNCVSTFLLLPLYYSAERARSLCRESDLAFGADSIDTISWRDHRCSGLLLQLMDNDGCFSPLNAQWWPAGLSFFPRLLYPGIYSKSTGIIPFILIKMSHQRSPLRP